MADWTSALADLRVFLADGPADHLVKEKSVLGAQDGANRTFYTFDDRLTASGVQTGQTYPLRVFQDGTEIAASGISVTNTLRGEFQITMGTPPGNNVRVTASYHYQDHLDSELSFFLQEAANQLSATAIAKVPQELHLAALHIAGSMAHQRLAQRWQQRKSDQFMLHDAPMQTQAEERVKYHSDAAAQMQKQGLGLRKAYYDLRLDRGRQPAFALLRRTPAPYTPRR